MDYDISEKVMLIMSQSLRWISVVLNTFLNTSLNHDILSMCVLLKLLFIVDSNCVLLQYHGCA